MLTPRARRLFSLVGAGFALILSGCDAIPRNIGPSERCADLMQRADPVAEIDVTNRESSASGLDTIIARVSGRRTSRTPEAPPAATVTAECRFEANVLTEFRLKTAPQR